MKIFQISVEALVQGESGQRLVSGVLPVLRTLRATRALRAMRAVSFVRGLQVGLSNLDHAFLFVLKTNQLGQKIRQ